MLAGVRRSSEYSVYKDILQAKFYSIILIFCLATTYSKIMMSHSRGIAKPALWQGRLSFAWTQPLAGGHGMDRVRAKSALFSCFVILIWTILHGNGARLLSMPGLEFSTQYGNHILGKWNQDAVGSCSLVFDRHPNR